MTELVTERIDSYLKVVGDKSRTLVPTTEVVDLLLDIRKLSEGAICLTTSTT